MGGLDVMTTNTDVRPLLTEATQEQTKAILGAMYSVAETGGSLTEADWIALDSVDRYIFGHEPPHAREDLGSVDPPALAAALGSAALREEAVRFLTVMAFIDGKLDKAKIARVLGYAETLGIHQTYLDEVKSAAEDRISEVLAHMTRFNMESITGKPWEGGDVNAWLLPYDHGNADPGLAQRFEGLSRLETGTFGHAFWQHFKKNNYAFPGNPTGLNAQFSVPHDSAHVLTGYDTDPRGEILVSTFTASMHPKYPMAGHILPVIFSWHLHVQINDVAKSAGGALDPAEFWHAWAAGANAGVDTFSPDWDFWAHAAHPLVILREQWNIPADGLDPRRP